MRKAAKAFAGVASAGIIALLALIIYIEQLLPAGFAQRANGTFYINDRVSLTEAKSDNPLPTPKIIDRDGNSYSLNIHLTGPTPALQVQLPVDGRKMVVPGGMPFGIKLHTKGAMVVGMTDIQIGTRNVNPAKDAGVKIGDVITHIDDKPVTHNDDIIRIISASAGKTVTLTLERDGDVFDVELKPVYSEFDKSSKAGVWVRDTSAGIGTMTYYDPQDLTFAGLGHAVCDVDTGAVMPLSHGEAVDVNISGVNMGQSGRPGELKGAFSEHVLGRLLVNSEFGIFGQLIGSPVGLDPVPMAYKQEVQPGPAIIYATLSGNKPRSFDIMIEKVNFSDISPTKNMVIRVTDPYLLAATGGIVQGMSGSPILQDGKLCGAVTHVFVNDPTRGYGIFAENMDRQITAMDRAMAAA